MIQKLLFAALLSSVLLGVSARAQDDVVLRSKQEIEDAKNRIRSGESNVIDEIDPFDPRTERMLELMDQMYEEETGEPATLEETLNDLLYQIDGRPTCYRAECPIWLEVIKSKQIANFYRDGQLEKTWKVSTGVKGHSTPNFDRNPNGRIYDRYESKKYPGGGLKGLGNMPYAVFISGGFAVHGTAAVGHLGKTASHGCIRQHPDNAKFFNREVRAQLRLPGSLRNVWITVR